MYRTSRVLIAFFLCATTPTFSQLSFDLQPVDLGAAFLGTAAEGSTADFDGDGHCDLAFGGGTSGPTLDTPLPILFGNGDGTFVTTSVTTETTSARAGDFNEDGIPDILVTSGTVNGIGILEGLGNRQFSSPIATTVGSNAQVNFFDIADVNNDGHLDVMAVVQLTTFSVEAHLLLGNGDSTFLPSTAVGTASAGASNVRFCDLNGDTFPDFILPADDAIAPFIGNGSGGFTAQPLIPLVSNPLFFAVADFDSDGFQDIATAPFSSGVLSIVRGDGAGGTLGIINTPFTAGGSGVFNIGTADLDSDGDVDIVLTAGTSNDVIIVENDRGVFLPTNLVLPHGPFSFLFGDFNEDGRVDFACGAGAHLTVALNSNPIATTSAFIRGDDNVDGVVDMLDPVYGLNYLFLGGESLCPSAQDTNDDGDIGLEDPLWNLAFQFLGGAPPPAPFPACGGVAVSCVDPACP